MTQSRTPSKLTQLAAVLAASVALIATTNIVSAHGSHHDSGSLSNSPSNSGKESSHKESGQKDKKEKSTSKKTCLYITAGGKNCGQTSGKTKKKDGTTQTSNKGSGTASANNGKPAPSTPSQTIGNPPPKTGPSPAFATVTITSGAYNSAIFNGKGITVKANPDNTITISNGSSSVTLATASVTLRGALTVSGGSDVKIVARNGDVIVAANPAPAAAPKPTGTSNPPPGVTFGDDVKAVGQAGGNASAVVAASPVILGTAAGIELGSVIVGTAAGHPIQAAKDTYNSLTNDVGSAVEWVGNLF
jgi:hypothetical protein